jgi:hypothetical protein
MRPLRGQLYNSDPGENVLTKVTLSSAEMFQLKRVTFCFGRNVSAKTRHVLLWQKCFDENAPRFAPAKMF